LELTQLIANGTLIWYYYICKREVWFISHGIEPNQESDLISIGRLIHENSYRKLRKELLIDGKIKVDILKNKKIVGEVKKSSKYLKSAKMQLAFYLYYLKEVKGIKAKGELLIPEEKKAILVELNSEIEAEIKKAVVEIERISQLPKPPSVTKTHFCRNCAYRELCWS